MQLPERFSDLPEHIFPRLRRLPGSAPLHALRRDGGHPQGRRLRRAAPDAPPDELAQALAAIRGGPAAGVQE
jgi:hypothetical protein